MAGWDTDLRTAESELITVLTKPVGTVNRVGIANSGCR
jgi:hypothetical protein